MSIELRHMRHLLALAEHGSFARAASALRLSQPALSRSIQSVEQQVGTELFLRSSAGVAPTDTGRLFLQRARQLVQLAADLDREVLSRRTLQSGQLSVGGGPFPVESILSAALARFVSEYPRVGVRLQVRDWDELLHRLRARELDFFVAEISTLERERDLEVEPLTEHPLFFAARSGHPLAGRTRVAAVDTFGFPFVALSRIPPRILEPMLDAQRRAPDPRAARRAFPALACNSLAAVRRIVLHSDAITAVTPCCIAAELESQQLALLGSEPWLSVRYGLVRLEDHPLNHAAEAFRGFVLEAERAASLEEQRLAARWRPRSASGRRTRPASKARRQASKARRSG